MTIVRKHVQPRGRGALANEMEQWNKRASLDVLQHDRDTEEAVADLRALNAERRLQDQRDLDADYRNYIVPV